MQQQPISPFPKKPESSALKQQRMRAWQPILDPKYVVITMLVIGVVFVPCGIGFNVLKNNMGEYLQRYDSTDLSEYPLDVDCRIDKANEGKVCDVTFTVDRDLTAPVLIHYEMGEFHQNHRRYIRSMDPMQLRGEVSQTALATDLCEPLYKLGNQTLNPCGLIANTFFNDVFTFVSATDSNGKNLDDYKMEEKGIAWKSDLDYNFKQPKGFRYEKCSSCMDCSCDDKTQWSCQVPYYESRDGSCYRYFYPHDDTTRYLHETYPQQISPIEGVTNEHFVVWMRVAALPTFRKLYGYFDNPISKGTTLTFQVTANFEVHSFKGQKALVLSETSWIGGKNNWIGWLFIYVGGACLFIGLLIAEKLYFTPRKLGDTNYLKAGEKED